MTIKITKSELKKMIRETVANEIAPGHSAIVAKIGIANQKGLSEQNIYPTTTKDEIFFILSELKSNIEYGIEATNNENDLSSKQYKMYMFGLAEEIEELSKTLHVAISQLPK